MTPAAQPSPIAWAARDGAADYRDLPEHEQLDHDRMAKAIAEGLLAMSEATRFGNVTLLRARQLCRVAGGLCDSVSDETELSSTVLYWLVSRMIGGGQ